MEEFAQEVVGKDVQLLDVRTTEEYASGHIEGAVMIDVQSASFSGAGK